MAQLSLLLLLSALQPVTISGDQILRYSIQEDLIPGTFIGNVKHDSEVVASFNASVLDSLMFGTLPGPYRQHFLVEETTGILRLSIDLDRDQICPNADNCVVSLEAAITWPMEYFRPIPIQIELLDLNDNAPQFPRSSETIQISENALTGSSYMLPTAVDPDSHSNRIQHYRLMPEMEMFSLNVDPVAGSLSLVLEHSVDREIQDSYSLQLLAQDGGQPPLSGILDLQIQIVDSNDNVPTFVQRQYNVSLQEDQDPLTPFLQVQATDPDEGLNGEVVYTLAPQTADSYGSLFSVDSSTGELSLQTALDYQMGDQYQLVIMARDQGQDSQQSYVQVYIYVRDVNNHAPEISASPVANNAIIGVKENLPGGAIAAIISVQDQDLGDAGRCDCVVMDTNFSLEPLYQNGFKLVTRRVLDRETAESYVTVVECQDNGTPALSSSLDVRVNILDDNDNPPVFSQREYRVGIQENEIGSLPVIRINASDLDAGDNGRVTYNLDSRVNSVLAIDQDSGVIRTKRPFDREAFSEYRFSVYANDNGEPSRTATAWVILNIQDVNDEAPRFTQTVFHFSVAENQKNNSEVGAVMAEDADSEPYNQFRFTLDGSPESLANFRIHPTRGMITTRKVLDREQHSSFSMLVVARNSQPPFLSSSATVTIYVIDENDNPPTISFPNPSNNRTVIQVSSYAPVGQSFTRITASDMDMGTNAKLQYKISNYGTPFGIDSVTGEIIVQTALDFYSEDRVVLYVEVSDEGQPPLSTRSTVHLYINRSVEFAQAQGYLPTSQGILGLGQHEEIILVLGSVTGVLIILLVAAIIFVRKRQLLQRKQLCHYAESLQLCPDFTGRSSGSDAGCEVTEVEDDRPPSAIASRQPSVRGERGEPLAITTNQKCIPNMERLSEKSRHMPPVPIRSHDFQKGGHYQPTMVGLSALTLDQDSDATSGCSGDVSTADSGHGPSLQGETTDGNSSNYVSPNSSMEGPKLSPAKPESKPQYTIQKAPPQKHTSISKLDDRALSGFDPMRNSYHGDVHTNNGSDCYRTFSYHDNGGITRVPPQVKYEGNSQNYLPHMDSNPYGAGFQGHVKGSVWRGSLQSLNDTTDDDDDDVSSTSGSFILDIGEVASVNV